MGRPAGRTGVMVIRIWTEGSDDPCRARLSEKLDVDAPGQVSHVAGTADEVVAIVRDWLARFGCPPPGD